MEYRHGPISTPPPAPGRSGSSTRRRGARAEVAATGATRVDAPATRSPSWCASQRLALAIAEARGSTPDHPPHLTRAASSSSRRRPDEARRTAGRDHPPRLPTPASVSVAELTDRLGALAATIRRDLELLEEQHLSSPAFARRRAPQRDPLRAAGPLSGRPGVEEKRRIAEAAAGGIG